MQRWSLLTSTSLVKKVTIRSLTRIPSTNGNSIIFSFSIFCNLFLSLSRTLCFAFSNCSYLDKMKKDMPNKISPSSEATGSNSPAISIQQINNLLKPSTSSNKSSMSSQYEFSSSSAAKTSSKERSKEVNISSETVICGQRKTYRFHGFISRNPA